MPSDLVTPLYCGMTNNLLLGMEEEEHYTEMLLRDVKKAGPARGKRIYWMHTIPFWSDALKKDLCFREEAQIVGCELARTFDGEFDPEKPYEAMAKRMVYHALNGPASRRIENGIRQAKEAGLPLLILDGDGCDRSRGGEGQTATRMEAFLEMLGGEAHE